MSEALILAATNPQYDKRLFIDLPVQYMKTTSLEHVVYANCFFFFLNLHSEQFMYTTCSELVIFMYWTCNSINNPLSYCGLVDARMFLKKIYLYLVTALYYCMDRQRFSGYFCLENKFKKRYVFFATFRIRLTTYTLKPCLPNQKKQKLNLKNQENLLRCLQIMPSPFLIALRMLRKLGKLMLRGAGGDSNFCSYVAACALLSTFVGFSRANVNYISILHVELFYFSCSLLFLVVHF